MLGIHVDLHFVSLYILYIITGRWVPCIRLFFPKCYHVYHLVTPLECPKPPACVYLWSVFLRLDSLLISASCPSPVWTVNPGVLTEILCSLTCATACPIIAALASVKLANTLHFWTDPLSSPAPTLREARLERGWGRRRHQATELQGGIVSPLTKRSISKPLCRQESAPQAAGCCSLAEVALWPPTEWGKQRYFAYRRSINITLKLKSVTFCMFKLLQKLSI